MLKLFRRYLKPYKWSIVAVVAVTIIQAWSQLYLPDLMSDIVDYGILQGDTAYILRTGGLMLAVTALVLVAAAIGSFLAARTSTGFARDVRAAVFEQVHHMPVSAVEELGTATLLTRTTNDIFQVRMVVQMGLRMMLISPIMLVGAVIMAVGKDARLSLIFAAAIPLIVGAVLLIARKGMPFFQLLQKKLDQLNLVSREALTGMRVIRAFDRIDYEQKRFEASNRDLTETAIRVNRIMAILQPTLMILMNLSIVAILWFGGLRVNAGTIQVGNLMAFIQYVTQTLFSLVMLSMIFMMIPRAEASAVRVNEVLAADREKDQAKEDGAPSPSPKGVVEFRNVSFRYPGAEEPVLADLNFTAAPGQVTAIIGSTGAGKTTLVSLIPRFFDVEEGSVTIDGVDVRDLPLEQLRAKIGFVPQKAVLFSGTVAENIRYGKPDATDEEIRHAAAIAQAADFIAALEQGYDSHIAQGGTNLSGGQKQRLTIARALVRKPLIYIFDDNFSALDYKTDARLRAQLRPEVKDATVIIVAQRVSTVMDADQIIVLDDGRIVGLGTHKELLENSEVYQAIVASQHFAEEESA